MSMKVKWMDLRHLKNLKREIKYIGSESLQNELDEAIDDNQGNYLCNILSDECIRELESLSQNYSILALI